MKIEIGDNLKDILESLVFVLFIVVAAYGCSGHHP
jgi:hypothetical protein